MSITRHKWGFVTGPVNAAASLAVIGGQHGDEPEGAMVAAAWAKIVTRLATGASSSALLRDAAGELVHVDVGFLAGLRLLVVPGLNRLGLSVGSRYATDDPAHWEWSTNGIDQIDPNRQWPSSPLVRPVWEEIELLPGLVHVVDVHANDRWPSKARPQTHAFVHERDGLLAAACPKLVQRIDARAGSLQDTAHRAGHWTATLEMGARSATTVHDGVQILIAIARAIAGQ